LSSDSTSLLAFANVFCSPAVTSGSCFAAGLRPLLRLCTMFWAEAIIPASSVSAFFICGLWAKSLTDFRKAHSLTRVEPGVEGGVGGGVDHYRGGDTV
jgi:hypothetical protein